MPINLKQCLGDITDSDIDMLVASITNNGKRVVGNFWKMADNDIRKILIAAKE